MKDEPPEELGWDAMQPNRKIGERQDEMVRPLGKDEMVRPLGKDEMVRPLGKETMERKNRKSGSTLLYQTLTPVYQGTRRKSTLYILSFDQRLTER